MCLHMTTGSVKYTQREYELLQSKRIGLKISIPLAEFLNSHGYHIEHLERTIHHQ